MSACEDCNGDGWIATDASTENEMVQDTSDCPACDGTGRTPRSVDSDEGQFNRPLPATIARATARLCRVRP